MSLEIRGPEFPGSHLLVVEARREAAAEEFLNLHNYLMTDPSAYEISSKERYRERKMRVPYWHDQTKILQAATWLESLEVGGYAPRRIYELAVIDPEGDISLAINKSNLSTIDLENDPFSQLVLDYFRLQYGELN